MRRSSREEVTHGVPQGKDRRTTRNVVGARIYDGCSVVAMLYVRKVEERRMHRGYDTRICSV